MTPKMNKQRFFYRVIRKRAADVARIGHEEQEQEQTQAGDDGAGNDQRQTPTTSTRKSSPNYPTHRTQLQRKTLLFFARSLRRLQVETKRKPIEEKKRKKDVVQSLDNRDSWVVLDV